MIHPHTELRLVSPEIGYGVFATAPIPAGTAVYVLDGLEIQVPPGDPRLDDPVLAPVIERYSYIDERGVRILSWDIAKYVNHACHPNTISTGYGFEIALRDIAPGEEITDDYGLFNLPAPMPLGCGEPDCRLWVRADDPERWADVWDAQVREALTRFEAVEQPLAAALPEKISRALTRYLRTGEGYRSVRRLQYRAGRAAEGAAAGDGAVGQASKLSV